MANIESAMAYLNKLPNAISGTGGHNITFKAVLACRRFQLSDGETWEAMQWFNANRCQPAWSEKELRHKIASVAGVAITKPLGATRSYNRQPRAFVAPVKPQRKPVDTRPVYLRSEQEEQLWWMRWCVAHGTTLEAFDAMVGND